MEFSNWLRHFLPLGLLGLGASACDQHCRAELERLKASADVPTERARAEQLSSCIAEHGLELEYKLFNPSTGKALSNEDLATFQGSVRVELVLEGRWKTQRVIWTARSLDSVWPLFRE